MGKRFKAICGIIFILFCTNSYAGPESLATYPWQVVNMPMLCGPVIDVNRALQIEGYIEIGLEIYPKSKPTHFLHERFSIHYDIIGIEILNSNVIFKQGWKLIKGWIDVKTSRKVFFVNDEDLYHGCTKPT